MLVELRVIGEDAEEIRKEVTQLAEALGVVAGDVALTEGAGGHTVVGTARAFSNHHPRAANAAGPFSAAGGEGVRPASSALATDIIEFDDGSMVWTTDGQIGVSRPAWDVIESGKWIDLRNWLSCQAYDYCHAKDPIMFPKMNE